MFKNSTIPAIILAILFTMLCLPLISQAQHPITIKLDKQNTVTLVTPATRIVVLEFSLLDDLLQLGVKPIGIASSRLDEGTNPPFLLPNIKDVPDVGTRQQPNLEKIKALHPDLIVADITMQGNLYPVLKEIAPTLLLNGLQGAPHTQINNLRVLARATGTQEKVASLATRLMTVYARAKRISANHKGTVIMGYVSNAGQFQALTANALTSTILKDLGRDNLVTVSRKEQSTPLPVETVLAQNPDSIIILLTDGDLSPFKTLSTRNPLWQELRAVKTNHVYFMDRDIWAKNHGLLATELLLKEAEKTGFLINQSQKEKNS